MADPRRLLGAARVRRRTAERRTARGLPAQGDAGGEEPHHVDGAGSGIRTAGAHARAHCAALAGGRGDPHRLDAPHRGRAAQRDPRPEAGAADDAGRAGRLPGQRVRGSLPRGPGQPPPGGSRRARDEARPDDRRCRPGRPRRREAVADPSRAGAAPRAPRAVPGPRGRLPSAGEHHRACRRLRPRERRRTDRGGHRRDPPRPRPRPARRLGRVLDLPAARPLAGPARRAEVEGGQLALSALLDDWPVALLVRAGGRGEAR